MAGPWKFLDSIWQFSRFHGRSMAQANSSFLGVFMEVSWQIAVSMAHSELFGSFHGKFHDSIRKFFSFYGEFMSEFSQRFAGHLLRIYTDICTAVCWGFAQAGFAWRLHGYLHRHLLGRAFVWKIARGIWTSVCMGICTAVCWEDWTAICTGVCHSSYYGYLLAICMEFARELVAVAENIAAFMEMHGRLYGKLWE